jgi:hypothetical protein
MRFSALACAIFLRKDGEPAEEHVAILLRKGRRRSSSVNERSTNCRAQRGPSGKPLNLDNLSKRVVSPLLKTVGREWHGWYSLRRGVAGLTRDGMASKVCCVTRILRLRLGTMGKMCQKTRF